MVIDMKMCRFEAVPWGFRLVGGSDFEYPLTVVKVTEGSIAEEAGLRVGDVIVRINDTPTSPLTHDETNRLIKQSGNVFYFGIQRENEEEENAPKCFPVASIERPITPLGFADDLSSMRQSPEDFYGNEYLPEQTDRPSSVLSENTEIKLVEEEIAAVLSGESEVLHDHNVMGLFPKPGVCMSSDVLRTLNEDAIKTKAERDKDNKKWTTFLQKPNRPIPKSKATIEAERRAANAYKVKIVKSAPRSRSVTPAPMPKEPTPEKQVEEQVKAEPEPEPEPEVEGPPPTDSEVPNLEEVKIVIKSPSEESETKEEVGEAQEEENNVENEKRDTKEDVEEQETANVEPTAEEEVPVEKTEEELALERQLADVQRQLVALSSLPSTIQATLDAVTKQLATLLPTFKLQQGQTTETEKTENEVRAISLEKIDEVNEVGIKETEQTTNGEVTEEQRKSEDDEEKEQNEAEIFREEQTLDPIKQLEGQQRKEETRQMETDQNLKKQKRHDVIEELEEQLVERHNKTNAKRSKRAFGPLTPSSERPLVLPGGRRWYKPKDAYNDEFIAETLSAQAELITGTTLGNNYESPLLPYDPSSLHAASVAQELEQRRNRVNFMKYQKPEKKIDFNRSEVYKVIHHLDRQPVRGIEVRPPVVPAAADIRQVVQQS